MFDLQVFKKKKEDYDQHKVSDFQEKEEHLLPDLKELATNDKFSYGKSTGIKDDLDVDENEIG